MAQEPVVIRNGVAIMDPNNSTNAIPNTLKVNADGSINVSNTAPTNITMLGQSNVPFVMAGSGSMGNNGALTLTTALAANPVITSCYVYLPAAAIVSGGAAGWYYAIFSSTTAATVYNNTYTVGTPAIPASPVAFATTGPGAYTGTSTAITSYSLTVPANTLGINGALRVDAYWSYTNAAGNKTTAISFGSYAFFSAVATTTVTTAGVWGIRNMGATNIQAPLTINAAQPFGTTTTAQALGAVDTTASQSLIVPLTNATPASNNLVLMGATVEFIPGVA